LVKFVEDKALAMILDRMTAAERFALAKRLVAEMPKDDRERLLAHSPGFVRFARAFLLFAGDQRLTA
jgi:hypothetical protein